MNVNITAARDCTWTAASEASWMQLSATSGQGNATLAVTVAQNDAGASRSGAIAVNNQRVTITQQPRPCTYQLRASPQSVNAAGGRGTISIDTLTGCTWTATSSATWLRVLTASGTGPGGVEFDVASNNGAQREATISIGDQSVTIVQGAGNQPGGGGTCAITLTPAVLNATAAGGTHSLSLSVASGCDWSASTNVPWLSVAPSNGRGNASLTVIVSRNTGGARSGSVSVGDQSTTVSQEGVAACTATIDASSASFPASGGEGRVRVTTQDGCDWTVTGGAQWTQILTARGTNSGEAQYRVAANTATSARATTLTIAGHSHTVTQEGVAAQTCTYTVQPGSQDFPAQGGTHTFTVATQAGCSWTASAPNWVTITSTTATSVSYSVPQNSGAARQGSITVSGGGGSASHNVTQQAAAQTCTFTLQPGSQDFPYSGGNNSFTVSTQQGCTWTASSNQPWAQVTSSSGSSPVSYSVGQNTGGARQATITVSGTSGGSAAFTVTQQAQPAPSCTYTLQPTSQDHPSGGGNGNFSVTTQPTCQWTASSNQGWASTTSSGTGNGQVSYTVQPNSGSARQATITVSGGGGSASHSVTQQAQPAPSCTYTVNPGSAQFPAAGGNGSFSVSTQSGCTWTFSGGASWITNVTQNGNTVSYTVQTNGTGAQRQASFSVNFSGGSQSHNVTQSP